MLTLPDSLRSELCVYAREVLPEEACGFLVGIRNPGLTHPDFFRLTAVRPARNLHPSRENRFTIDPLEYAKVEDYCRKRAREGIQVLGFWHSHPQSPPRPSAIDLEEAIGLQCSFPQRYLYLILSLQDPGTPAFACWRLKAEGTEFETVDLRSEI